MSLYKVQETVLNAMESIRRNFFNGIQDGDKKISWIKWAKGTVASKLSVPLSSSFRRDVRGGADSEQLSQCLNILGSVILSNSEDRYFWDINGDGEFRVKDIRLLLDDAFLPKDDSSTRWVKSIPIKINIFAWKVSLARLPTRHNLVQRGII
nr:RNA-directed DNA polymerase, eukaryota [Tanacetum cinerariifolium]